MIETINLTKRYEDVLALDNLNLSIAEGECFGFIGPNGAGKTTTIRILATLLRPTWGEARIAGLSVGPVNARQVRALIGYVPDYFGSYPDLLVREYLEFFAAAYGIHGLKRKRVVDDALALTDLTSKADTEVNALSRGMKQRLALARVLLHDPQVLLLDEPASGLDPRARIEIRELLKELHRLGKTILISSHILVELADLCTSVGIIERGRLLFTGTIPQLLARARMGPVLHVRVAEHSERAAELIRSLPGVVDVELHDHEIHVRLQAVASSDRPHPFRPEPASIGSSFPASAGDPALIAQKLVTHGFRLLHLAEEPVNLEAAFLRLTRGLVQ